MGVAFCVVFKKDVPPHGKLGGDNMVLAKEHEKLDALADKNGLRTLGSFLSQDPEELAAMMDMDPEEMGLPPEQWFNARAGLAAVKVLSAYLRDQPTAVTKAKEMLSELEQVETELGAAAASK